MRLDQRKEDILGFIVRDYVHTAFPISSNMVVGGLKLEVSPATIRNTMLALDKEGYLYQPYTSAGRAPTEKGYRYFIGHLMSVRQPEAELCARIDKIFENMEQETGFAFDELSRAIAGHLKLFSGVGLLDTEEKFFARGMSEVLRSPEFEERNLAAEFADFAENMESNLLELKKNAKFDYEPTFRVSGFGIASVFFDDDELGRCAVFSAGPKRMNYEKAASVLKYAAKDIKSKNKKHARRGKH
ncbi:hypothetical protein A3C77_04500 [Candidatus Giovannonibacteria bacterium RIFCSPHIGHO2_02_FULL_45_13]|nr:MAG: hypothetical protein A3C77_04500 [Candidatus Giovannonibacteria bacterium RIFCSPHIGHO2_02_FULL_45_13]